MNIPIFIYTLSIWLAGLFDLILLVCSLIFCTRSRAPRCLKIFPVYAALNILSDIISLSLPNLITIDYTAFSLIEMLYFSYILAAAVNRNAAARLIWLTNGIVIAILGFLLWYHPSLLAGLLLHLEAIVIILAAIVYLYNIPSKRSSPPLSEDPLFWFAIGLTFDFFLELAILFISGSYSFLKKQTLSDAFYSANNFSAVFTYLLFIKGMSCIPKK